MAECRPGSVGVVIDNWASAGWSSPPGCASRSASSEPQVRRASCTVIFRTAARPARSLGETSAVTGAVGPYLWLRMIEHGPVTVAASRHRSPPDTCGDLASDVIDGAAIGVDAHVADAGAPQRRGLRDRSFVRLGEHGSGLSPQLVTGDRRTAAQSSLPDPLAQLVTARVEPVEHYVGSGKRVGVEPYLAGLLHRADHHQPPCPVRVEVRPDGGEVGGLEPVVARVLPRCRLEEADLLEVDEPGGMSRTPRPLGQLPPDRRLTDRGRTAQPKDLAVREHRVRPGTRWSGWTVGPPVADAGEHLG